MKKPPHPGANLGKYLHPANPQKVASRMAQGSMFRASKAPGPEHGTRKGHGRKPHPPKLKGVT